MTQKQFRIIKINNGKFVPQVKFAWENCALGALFGEMMRDDGFGWQHVLSASETSEKLFLEFSTLEEAKAFLDNLPTSVFEIVYTSEIQEVKDK